MCVCVGVVLRVKPAADQRGTRKTLELNDCLLEARVAQNLRQYKFGNGHFICAGTSFRTKVLLLFWSYSMFAIVHRRVPDFSQKQRLTT